MSSWEKNSRNRKAEEKFSIRLPLKDAARLEALSGLYPGLQKAELLSQLVAAALDEVEQHMPYKQGDKVVAIDELGDPLYEDVGLTPRYLKLRQQYVKGKNGKH